MHTDPRSRSSFKFSENRLLKLRSAIPMSDMRSPTTVGANQDPCITVIQRDSPTNTTIGRASSIMSLVHDYFNDNSSRTSFEWTILPYNNRSGVFSAPGDSGAVVVDGGGHIGGLLTGLTGGAGLMPATVFTYVTPIDSKISRLVIARGNTLYTCQWCNRMSTFRRANGPGSAESSPVTCHGPPQTCDQYLLVWSRAAVSICRASCGGLRLIEKAALYMMSWVANLLLRPAT